MSVNKVDKTTGELVTLANGTRMWIGTQSAHDAAVQAGIMPNNCMVCITDDAPGTDAFNFSTTEVKTPYKWIDGRSIYRKVVLVTQEFELPTSGWISLASYISASDLAILQTMKYIVNCFMSMNPSSTYNIFEHLVAAIDGTTVKLQDIKGYTLHAGDLIVFEYTKASDY